jgi:hypothetical protein
MSKFKVDIDKVIKGVETKTIEQGYVYPSVEFITNISEELKMFDVEIADMAQDELLNKLSVFTSLHSSATVDEAKYKVKVAALKRELDIVKASVFTASKAEKVRDKEKERDSNEEVVELQERLTLAEAFLEKYSALRIGYEKYCFLYSRALTALFEEKKLQ